jgi:ribosomal protein S18 acetylase RimI-like enzyme
MDLRPAVADDLDVLAAVWSAAWRDGHAGHVPDELVDLRTPDDFRRRLPERLERTTVAAIDGEVVGFVSIKADELEELFVAASARGTGTAAALIDHGEQQIARAHDTAWLAVVAGNARARNFYERQGWSDHGEFAYAADGMTVTCHRYEKPVGLTPLEEIDPGTRGVFPPTQAAGSYP